MQVNYSLISVLIGSVLLTGCGGEDASSAIKQPEAPHGLFFGFHKPSSNSSATIQLGSVALFLKDPNTPLKGEFSFQYDAACQPSNALLVAGLKSGNDVAGSGLGRFDRQLNSNDTLPLTLEFAGDFSQNPELKGKGYYGGLYSRKANEQPLNTQSEQRRYAFCQQSYRFEPKGIWTVFAENEQFPSDFKVQIESNTQQVTWTFPNNFVPQTALISFYDRNKLTQTDQTALVRQITTSAMPARINLPTDFNLSTREYTVVVQLFDANLKWGAIGQTRVNF